MIPLFAMVAKTLLFILMCRNLEGYTINSNSFIYQYLSGKKITKSKCTFRKKKSAANILGISIFTYLSACKLSLILYKSSLLITENVPSSFPPQLPTCSVLFPHILLWPHQLWYQLELRIQQCVEAATPSKV